MLKGPKRSFVVVVGVVETLIKDAQNGTKNVREQNLLQIEQKIFANENIVQSDMIMCFLSHLIFMFGLLRLCMVLYGLLWSCMAFYGL